MQVAAPDLSSAQTSATTDFQVPAGSVTTKNFRPGNSPAGLTRVDHGYLPADTAAAFNAMRSAFKQATGKSLTLTEGWRSMADTAKLHAQNPKVNAPAGKSKHNWGRALDLSGMGYGTSSFQWLLKNAGRFGFNWNTGRRINEPWHWEYTG
jgi:LAS superfamily LD-carboxypeptidase LdcB